MKLTWSVLQTGIILPAKLTFRDRRQCSLLLLTLSRQPRKIVKHTQTIHREKPANYLSVFDHFLGLALKELIEFERIS